MQFSFYLAVLSSLGFANAFFLHWQYQRFRTRDKKIFCLIGEDCSKVVDSNYGMTFRIKNEIWGMLFYSFVLASTILIAVYPVSQQLLWPLLWLVSILSAAFSVYLLYLQIWVIKELCSWCLISILINFIIPVLIWA